MNMGLKCLASGLWPVLASVVALLALQERSRRAFVHVSEWGVIGCRGGRTDLWTHWCPCEGHLLAVM